MGLKQWDVCDPCCVPAGPVPINCSPCNIPRKELNYQLDITASLKWAAGSYSGSLTFVDAPFYRANTTDHTTSPISNHHWISPRICAALANGRKIGIWVFLYCSLPAGSLNPAKVWSGYSSNMQESTAAAPGCSSGEGWGAEEQPFSPEGYRAHTGILGAGFVVGYEQTFGMFSTGFISNIRRVDTSGTIACDPFDTLWGPQASNTLRVWDAGA
jgi:hypothetical protein